jgi:hypothetical protein
VSRDQLCLTNFPSKQIREPCSIGLYDLPVFNPSGNNFSINGRVLFQNTSPTTTDLLFQLAKPFPSPTGTIGQLTFKACAQLETVVPLLDLDIFDTSLSMGGTTGFLAVIPSDAIIAAGPTHIIPVVNSTLAIINKAPPHTELARQSLYNFWGANVAPPIVIFSGTPPTGDRVFDPWVVYDQFDGRFVVISVRIRFELITANSTGYILLARSKTSTPTTLTPADWDFYQYDRTLSPGVTPTFPDYPKLGYDDLAYYISENNFEINTGIFINTKVFALRKADFPASVAIDTGLTNTLGIIPVQSYEATSAAMFCVSNQNGLVGGVVRVYALDKITNQFITQFNLSALPAQPYINTIVNIPQPNIAATIETGNRFNNQCAVLRRNGTDRLWTAIGVPITGIVDSNGNLQTVIRWCEINLGSWPTSGSPSIAQLQFVRGDGNDSLSYPHINVDSLHNMSIGCSICSLNRYAGIAMFARLATDPPNTTRSPVIIKSGTHPYNINLGGTRNRWGDYSGLAIDPNDSRTFWLFNQYASTGPDVSMSGPGQTGGWRTTVATYRLDETSPYQTSAAMSSFTLMEPGPHASSIPSLDPEIPPWAHPTCPAWI